MALQVPEKQLSSHEKSELKFWSLLQMEDSSTEGELDAEVVVELVVELVVKLVVELAPTVSTAKVLSQANASLISWSF